MTELISAYQATTYWVARGSNEFGLRVGIPSSELEEIFKHCGVRTAAFITAYNPFSRPTSLEANERAQASLRRELHAVSELVLNGRGEGAGDWSPEPSFLAIGLKREQAEVLGQRYDQHAIVWIGDDSVPKLVVLSDLAEQPLFDARPR
jgi:hypothetical protein